MLRLNIAAETGDLAGVKALVRRRADANAQDQFGYIPLIWAAALGHQEMVRYFVENGADVDAKDKYGVTLLIEAAREGHLALVRCLMENGADVNGKDEDGYTPLINAVFYGHLEVVRYLVELGANLNTKDKYEDTLLAMAAREGHLDVVRWLMENVNQYGDTPLAGAAQYGHLDVVRCLVENGGDVNAKDNGGCTPLIKAVLHGHLEVVRYLVENGADLNANDHQCGRTPLTWAAYHDHVEVVRYLVGIGADVNANDQYGDTPLIEAAREGHLDVVRCLVENDANVNPNDQHGDTPLVEAAREGHLDMVRCLVENGADVNAKGQYKNTPLLEAAYYDHLEVVRYLAENGADVNAKNLDGMTALDVASSSAVAQCLVNQGDETMQRDWLIPEDQVELENRDERGSNQLHVVEWLGAKVVIKPVGSGKISETRQQQQLLQEAKVWHRLYHPHVVLMFGACYFWGNPFVVCEYAPNGNLTEYLKAHPKEVWQKLYEAALGLSFLHRMRVVHGDLKCSNILIGSDGFTKLTNFGLSSLESLDDPVKNNKTLRNKGAFRRLVGGVLKRDSAYESDLHSFGLCIIDAVSGKMSKRRRLLAGVGLTSNRPEQFTDAQWNLVKRLCRSKTKHGLSAIDLVQELRIFADEEKEDKAHDNSVDTVWINDMLQKLADYCNDTNGADRMNRQVYERLTDVYKQLKPQSTFLSRYSSMTEIFWRHMQARSSCSTSSSLSMIEMNYAMSRQVANDASFFHHKIDRFMAAASLSMSAEIHNWRRDWNLVRKAQNHKFMNKTRDTKTLLEDIPEEEHEEVLTNLRFELSKNYTNYETSASEYLVQARTVISTLCKDKGILYESWFIPEGDVAFDEHDKFASGGFGSVHHGKWLDARVVIKTVNLNTVDNFRDMFLKEVKVWRRLYHPNIVQMYGACHVGKPFIVCAFATNGQLDKYLKKHPINVWGKLYEAALGLRYLHYMRVIHGDLKCNNILIGADGRAKLTDFGLSSIEERGKLDKNAASDSKHGIGAVRWKAPEVLKGGRATFQSDLYSFGMCIIEAVSGKFPWGLLEDTAVTYYVKNGKIPKRSEQFTDKQWVLVEGLCRYERSERLPIVKAVGQLKSFAGLERQKKQ